MRRKHHQYLCDSLRLTVLAVRTGSRNSPHRLKVSRKSLDGLAEKVRIHAFCNFQGKKEENTVAEKISKTARASSGDRAARYEKPCPACGTGMIATKVMRYHQTPGGMYWVCPKDDQRIKI